MLAVKIARRGIAKLMGIVGFVLALLGGVLIGVTVLTSGGTSPTSIVLRFFEGLLAIGAILAGMMIYAGPMRFGGILAVVGGIVLLAVTGFGMPAVLVFAAGVVGIIGAELKPAWWKFWKR